MPMNPVDEMGTKGLKPLILLEDMANYDDVYLWLRAEKIGLRISIIRTPRWEETKE